MTIKGTSFHQNYPDIGCPRATDYLGGVQSYCLSCPFKKCLEESFREAVKLEKQVRDKAIRKQYRKGLTVKQLAENYGVGERTIRRVLKSE